jgi:hypothetical protein
LNLRFYSVPRWSRPFPGGSFVAALKPFEPACMCNAPLFADVA